MIFFHYEFETGVQFIVYLRFQPGETFGIQSHNSFIKRSNKTSLFNYVLGFLNCAELYR